MENWELRNGHRKVMTNSWIFVLQSLWEPCLPSFGGQGNLLISIVKQSQHFQSPFVAKMPVRFGEPQAYIMPCTSFGGVGAVFALGTLRIDL